MQLSPSLDPVGLVERELDGAFFLARAAQSEARELFPAGALSSALSPSLYEYVAGDTSRARNDSVAVVVQKAEPCEASVRRFGSRPARPNAANGPPSGVTCGDIE